MKAINLFNKWVELGKDDGMEVNHTPSVDYMFNLIPKKILKSNFTFLDIGCGNGWVVKKTSSMKECVSAVGIDGSENMIKKAISKDMTSTYLQMDLNNLNAYTDSFDIVFSMEVFYYLTNPQITINHIFNHLLNKNGCFIIGIDHYLENKPSLKWPIDLNVHMWTYSILQWEALFRSVGFKNIIVEQFGQKNDWSGTLVLYGEKH
ncbi:MAG: nodulation protein S NodS [Flavobacteriales bacterium]|nr:nodulation protein S NodS [Flavobacteriales bacterium]|tara:strand:+ start:5150 stop:5764 length:615 start_codon:yes stop_codon:yes gene_type:complete